MYVTALLMRSPWPSKVLTAPLLTALPWGLVYILNYNVRHPNLALFRRLAFVDHRLTSAQQQEVRTPLPDVVADELFFFAFVYQGYPPQGGTPPPPPDLQMWLPSLKNEATVQVCMHLSSVSCIFSRMRCNVFFAAVFAV